MSTKLLPSQPLFFVDFDGEWSERSLPEGTGYLLLGENIFNGSPIVDLETLGLSAEIIRHRIDNGENFGDIVEEAIKILKEKQTK